MEGEPQACLPARQGGRANDADKEAHVRVQVQQRWIYLCHLCLVPIGPANWMAHMLREYIPVRSLVAELRAFARSTHHRLIQRSPVSDRYRLTRCSLALKVQARISRRIGTSPAARVRSQPQIRSSLAIPICTVSQSESPYQAS